MSRDRIEVVRTLGRPRRQLRWGWVVDALRYGWWLGPVAAAWVGVTVFGLPHLRWRYEYVDRLGSAFYLSCDYVGPFGSGRLRPGDGQCPIVAWFRDGPAVGR